MQFKKLPGGPGLPDFPEFSYLKVFYNFLERSGQTTAELRTFSFRDTAELSIYWRQAIADVIEFIDITKFIIMENKEKKDAPAKKENQKKTSPKNTEGTSAKTDSKSAKETKAAKTAEPDNSNEGKEFREFFIDELKDILWAEKALLKALPKMGKAATGKELAASFDEYLKETETQITVIEKVFGIMEAKAATKKCDAMEGLLSEADSIISDTDKGSSIRDAGLILAAQKVKHYEIATYGTLAAFADAMDRPDVAKELRSILRDEKKSDKELTALALESVNEAAAEE